MSLQRTLKSEVCLQGIGLHSGNLVQVTLKPAQINRGIVFVRSDLEGSPEIPAHFRNIVNTQLATSLGKGNATVSTVEHVLAALQGMGIDNALVEVTGPEIPILDGSSWFFCEAILKAGIETQLQFRPYFTIKKKIEVKFAEKWAVAEPAARLEIHGSIDWDHPSIGYQEFHYHETKTDFMAELSRARTFGFLHEVEAMKKMGLARGGTLENAVVLDHAFVLNPDGLRYPNEFVRHKILDALGDFKLAGVGLHAFIRLHRAGHDLHSKLLQEIFKDSSNYELVDGTKQIELLTPSLQTALAGRILARC